jgi:hypothetical protein
MNTLTLYVLKILTSISFLFIVVSFGQVMSAFMILVLLSHATGNGFFLEVVLDIALLFAAGRLCRYSKVPSTFTNAMWSICCIVLMYIGAIVYFPWSVFDETLQTTYITFSIFFILSIASLIGLVMNVMKSRNRHKTLIES